MQMFQKAKINAPKARKELTNMFKILIHDQLFINAPICSKTLHILIKKTTQKYSKNVLQMIKIH